MTERERAPAHAPLRWLLAAGMFAAGVYGQSTATLTFVTTAHQDGPVGYRDPLGVISPSGEWLAYSISHRLYLRRIAGGTTTELAAGLRTIRHIAWQDDHTLVTDSGETQTRWWSYDTLSGSRHLLWPDKTTVEGKAVDSGELLAIPKARLEQLAWSADSRSVAGVAHTPGGTQLWILSAEGTNGRVLSSSASLSYPAWAPDGRLACLADSDGRQSLSFPCGAKSTAPKVTVYGPLAFSPDGKRIYLGQPNGHGTVDVWSRPILGGEAGVQLTRFSNDTYSPSAARTGVVLVKRSDYRTFVAAVDATGGPVTPLALFQSMTPSWNPAGDTIALTFGNWRRVVDDFHYPDIAQDIGLISLANRSPALAPSSVVLASPSEDQALCWSPNAKWIVLHSHKDNSDDLWIQPADGSVQPKLLTHFGRGAETDWPRWSQDGKWVIVAANKVGENPPRHVVYSIGLDQVTGAVTQPPAEIRLDDFTDEITHAEWATGSEQVVFQAYREGNQQGFYIAPRVGGRPKPLFHFASQQHVAGFSVSPDGAWLAYVAPAKDGYLQLFRIPFRPLNPIQPVPEQLTFDLTNKTQPAYSPDGRRIALTLWNYDVQFWTL